jgi:hypothetical protein
MRSGDGAPRILNLSTEWMCVAALPLGNEASSEEERRQGGPQSRCLYNHEIIIEKYYRKCSANKVKYGKSC